MHNQEHKAGFVQYLVSLAAGILVWVVCDIIGIIIENMLLSDIIFIVMEAIVVYYVYVHYCAVFQYEANENGLKITRQLGHKKIINEISYNDIDGVYDKKTADIPKDTEYYTVRSFIKKEFCYIVYNDKTKCIVIEPDKELREILKEKING